MTGGLPLTRDVEQWKHCGPNLDDQLDEKDQSLTELSGKKKVTSKLSKDTIRASRVRNGSSLKKKRWLSSIVIQSSLKKLLYAEKTMVGTTPSSSAKIKHIIGVDNKKVYGMWDIIVAMLKL